MQSTVAMILAAGRGERMRPLTDAAPKPLLEVAGKSLILRQVERLVAGGFSDIVINHAWMGEKIEAALGNGSRFGARIVYSAEGEALETAGGIVHALPLLGNRPFVVTSGDVYTEYPYAQLLPVAATLATEFPRRVAHFVMTDNPPFHQRGDMTVKGGMASMAGDNLNYSGIAVYHPALFQDFKGRAKMKLFPWAFQFVREGKVSAEHFSGQWDNVGTPVQLEALNQKLLRSTV